jgi:hypothetical protein
MLLECESCGAPLDVAENTAVVRCHYCGRSATVEQFRKVAPQTPAGFVPPAQWTPPETASVPSRPLRYRPRRGRGGSVFSSLGILACIMGFVVWRATSAIQSVTATADVNDVKSMFEKALTVASAAVEVAKTQQARSAAPTGDTVPVVCKGSDDVTLVGKRLSMPSGVPVVATGNCVLRLVDCVVDGATGITASNNANVSIQGGSVAGKGPAVVLMGNSSLDVSGGARLSGEMTITAATNARARVRGSSIVGGHVAVHVSGNASVDTEGSDVKGRVLGGRNGMR